MSALTLATSRGHGPGQSGDSTDRPASDVVASPDLTHINDITAVDGDVSFPRGEALTQQSPRPARNDITWTLRDWLPDFVADVMSGLFGVIVETRPIAHDGPMNPQEGMLPSNRNAPTIPWDNGLSINPVESLPNLPVQ